MYSSLSQKGAPNPMHSPRKEKSTRSRRREQNQATYSESACPLRCRIIPKPRFSLRQLFLPSSLSCWCDSQEWLPRRLSIMAIWHGSVLPTTPFGPSEYVSGSLALRLSYSLLDFSLAARSTYLIFRFLSGESSAHILYFLFLESVEFLKIGEPFCSPTQIKLFVFASPRDC